MRGNMDPLAPTTHTLGPAIAHIAETASSLSASRQHVRREPNGLGIALRAEAGAAETQQALRRRQQKETVRWVLDTPRRLRAMRGQEQEDGARAAWKEVSALLDQWAGVAGVQELREECERIMKHDHDSHGDSLPK